MSTPIMFALQAQVVITGVLPNFTVYVPRLNVFNSKFKIKATNKCVNI